MSDADWEVVDATPDAPPLPLTSSFAPALRKPILYRSRRGTIPVWAYIEAKEHQPEPFTMHASVWNGGLPSWVIASLSTK